MYSVALATAGVYLAAIFVFSAVASCVGCVSCGCVNPLKTVYYFGDAVFLIGVIWRVALYAANNVDVPDVDGLLAFTYCCLPHFLPCWSCPVAPLS